MPYYGANRPDAKVSQAILDAFWLQGMRAGIPDILASIKAFSESDHTDDLKAIDVPPLISARVSSIQVLTVEFQVVRQLPKRQTLGPHSVIVSDGDEFTVDESWVSTQPAVENRLGKSGVLASYEKALVEEALRASGGRVSGRSGAAVRLGIPRSTLESKIRALRINKSRFRTRAPKRL